MIHARSAGLARDLETLEGTDISDGLGMLKSKSNSGVLTGIVEVVNVNCADLAHSCSDNRDCQYFPRRIDQAWVLTREFLIHNRPAPQRGNGVRSIRGVHSAGGAVRHVGSSKARKFLRNDGFGRPHAMTL